MRLLGKIFGEGVYARTTQGLEIKIVNGEKLGVSVVSELNARGMYSSDTINGASQSNADFNFDLDVGVRSNYVIGRTRNMTQFVVRGQFDQKSALALGLNQEGRAPTSIFLPKVR